MKDLSPTRARALWHTFMTKAATAIHGAHQLPSESASDTARKLIDRALTEFGRGVWLYCRYRDSWKSGDSSVLPSAHLLDRLRAPDKAFQTLAEDLDSWAFVAQWDVDDYLSHIYSGAYRRHYRAFFELRQSAQLVENILRNRGSQGTSDEIEAVGLLIEKLLVFDCAHAINRNGLINDDTIVEQSLLLPVTHPVLYEATLTRFKLEIRRAFQLVDKSTALLNPVYAPLVNKGVPHRVVHGLWPFLDERARTVVHSTGVAVRAPWYAMCLAVSQATNLGFRIPRGLIQLIEQEIAVRQLSIEQRRLASNTIAKVRLLDPVDESEPYALICRDSSAVKLPYEELRVGTVAGGTLHALWPHLSEQQKMSIQRFGTTDDATWPAIAVGLRDAALMNELAHRPLSYLATSPFRSVFEVGTKTQALPGAERRRSV